MSRIRLAAVVVIASMLLATMPAGVFAADNTRPVPGIRASIDRAVAKALAEHPPATTKSSVRRSSAAAAQGGGGGAGKVMAVVAIVGAVGGLAATYYIVKQMQKQTNTNTNGQ